MIDVLTFLGVLSAALFAGAALYINLAEHPARMALDTRAAALQWAHSYKRATWMQAPLAIISLVSGAALSFLGAGMGWLLAGTLLGAVVPFTLISVKGTTNKLLEPGRDLSSPETRSLLVRWGRLHAIRTALSLVSTTLYLSLLLDAFAEHTRGY